MRKYSDQVFNQDLISHLKKKQEVHVHILHPDQIEDDKYNPLLDKQEKQKSQSFVFAKDRRLYTAAHLFLRQTLSLYEPFKQESWQFSYDHFGKPAISSPNPNHLTFNLSHTHSMIACTVSFQINLGVDVERHRSLDNFKGMLLTGTA